MSSELKSQIDDWKLKLHKAVGVRDQYQEKREELIKKQANNKKSVEEVIQALNFVEKSVQSIRNKTLRSIESVTNESLHAVYNENLNLQCEFGIKRDRSAVTFRYAKNLKDGKTILRNPDGSGCGVSDVVAFTLRLVLIKATGSEPILIADEPFKWIDRDQIAKAALLLKYLSHKLGIQIIITSHHRDLRDVADQAYGLEMDENEIVQIISEGA